MLKNVLEKHVYTCFNNLWYSICIDKYISTNSWCKSFVHVFFKNIFLMYFFYIFNVFFYVFAHYLDSAWLSSVLVSKFWAFRLKIDWFMLNVVFGSAKSSQVWQQSVA